MARPVLAAAAGRRRPAADGRNENEAALRGAYRAVLSIGKLAAGPGVGGYYVEQVADGREDYYAGEGEAPGQWVGAGSAELGLGGRVGEDELLRLLAGKDPATGRLLGRELKPGTVAGFDLTFRSPKSVSILFGVGDAVLAAEIRRGHTAAVAAAMGYLERKACVVRRGKGGVVELPGGGFVAAGFEHRSSRAGDPLLHTHVVVANAALGPGGRWTALFGRKLYEHAKTAGFLYQAALREELTRRLGLEWEPVINGAADVRGISRELIEHFSQRRLEILEVMAARGEHSARAAQVATLDTRRAKQLVLHGDQRGAWRERAAHYGLDLHGLDRMLGRIDPGEPTLTDAAVVADRLLGPDGLTRHASTFDRRDALQALAGAAPRGASVAALEARADALLQDDRIVPLDDGRFSTAELVALEQALLAGAAGRTQERPAFDRDAVNAALRARPSMSREQQQMVARLVASPGGVQIVLAPAGTGKTFALDAARETWQRAGVSVLGCALSARAACELRDQAAIEATTIARLRMALDAGSELQPGSVLIVDEAGMVGTRDLAALAAAAERAQARLILVGDDRQLSEIEAGGAFAALARQVVPITLREVRRQQQAWDRDALAELRSGDVAAFADSYAKHGRVVTRPTAEAARGALVGDWWQAVQDGRDAAMIAHRRADVAELNDHARTLMRADGQLGEDRLRCGPRSFAIGDRVVATRNDRRLDVHNGQAGQIVDLTDSAMHLALRDGRALVLPVAYARDGHLDHAYALTAHRAQGATVDSTFVLGSDELTREWGYTALSRHRHEARFYLSASPTFLNAPVAPLTGPTDGASAVARALGTSRRQQLASIGLLADPKVLELRDARADARRAAAQLETAEARYLATPLLRWRERGELRREVDEAARRHAAAATRAELLANRPGLARLAAERGLGRAPDPLANLSVVTQDSPTSTTARERPAPALDLTLDL